MPALNPNVRRFLSELGTLGTSDHTTIVSYFSIGLGNQSTSGNFDMRGDNITTTTDAALNRSFMMPHGLFTSGGVVTVRVFTPERHPQLDIPIKRVRMYAVMPGGSSWQRVPATQVQEASCMDSAGQFIGIEPAVVYE